MQLPRKLITEFNEVINNLSGSAQSAAEAAIKAVIQQWDGADIAALRVAAYEALDLVCSAYADISAAYGAEFYDAMRQAQGVKSYYDSVAYSAYDSAATEGAVRALLDSVVKTGETDRFLRNLADRANVTTRRAANMSIAHNTRRDPAKPTYARVPSGETCGFCLMQASFGFHYRSEEAASHSHKNCDCRVVPKFGKSLTVGGYDPDGMYKKTQQVIKDLGGRDAIREQWNALSSDERQAYLDRHNNKQGEAFQAFMNGKVTRAIEQNREWFVG